jgi:hypothetical protein
MVFDIVRRLHLIGKERSDVMMRYDTHVFTILYIPISFVYIDASTTEARGSVGRVHSSPADLTSANLGEVTYMVSAKLHNCQYSPLLPNPVVS